MLQIIAYGIAGVLIGIGSMARSLTIIATPIEKRKATTGAFDHWLYVGLGVIIFFLALLQGNELQKLME